MALIFAPAFAFLLSLTFTNFIISLSDPLRWLLRSPSEDRWNTAVVPSFGGLAIFLAFFIPVLAFRYVQQPRFFGPLDPNHSLVWCSVLVLLLGLWDDLRPLPPYAKLVGQIAAACALVALGVHINLSGNPLIYTPLTILWVVGITNAFNLLDNMDGLCAGIALIIAATLAIIANGSGSPVSLALLICFCATVLGFLFFNVNPAKIFMGDCGSQWIGFMLAGFTVIDTWKGASNLLLMIVTPFLLLAIPIFDTTLVTINRKLHGRSVSQGGKDHSSHRLVALGFSEKTTVRILWGLSLVFGLSAYFSHIYRVEAWGVLAGFALVFVLVFGRFLTGASVYEKSTTPTGEPGFLLRLTVLHKRRMAEILIDMLLIGGCYVLAFLIRFDWSPDAYQRQLLFKSIPLVVAAKLVSFLVFGLYRGIWSYINFEGLIRLLRTSFLATASAVVAILTAYHFSGFSRTLFVIDFALLFMMMGGVRALLRGLRESVFSFPDKGTRVLIIGAGDTARMLLSEIRKRRDWSLTPVALLDDDTAKMGSQLLGVRVAGPTSQLEQLATQESVEQVILAIPSASSNKRKALEEECSKLGIPVISMPSLEELIIRSITR